MFKVIKQSINSGVNINCKFIKNNFFECNSIKMYFNEKSRV